MTPAPIPNPSAFAGDAAVAFAFAAFAVGSIIGFLWLGVALGSAGERRLFEPPREIVLDAEVVLPDVHLHRAARRGEAQRAARTPRS